MTEDEKNLIAIGVLMAQGDVEGLRTLISGFDGESCRRVLLMFVSHCNDSETRVGMTAAAMAGGSTLGDLVEEGQKVLLDD